MPDLLNFHSRACELLRFLGWTDPVLGAEQDVVTLLLERGIQLHFGQVSTEHWFMMAELGVTSPSNDSGSLFEALRSNQPIDSTWQPIAAINEQGRLIFWVRLPVAQSEFPDVLGALDALIDRAEEVM